MKTPQEALDQLIREIEHECIRTTRPSRQRLREAIKRATVPVPFDSAAYWENRYYDGGNSGDGSGGLLAQHKADFINSFVATRHIQTVVEFGCGDGRQLALADYPDYLGLDVSPTALALCRDRFLGDRNKTFGSLPLTGSILPRDLALSLDVVFHLVEDAVYGKHLHDVFSAANRYVIVYTTDPDKEEAEWTAPHVRHRHLPNTVERNGRWDLIEHHANPYPGAGGSDFYVYAR